MPELISQDEKRALLDKLSTRKLYRTGTIEMVKPGKGKRAAEAPPTDGDESEGGETEEGDGAGERKRFRATFSSESEVDRWFGVEILGHKKDEVDMSYLANRAAVLVDHEGDQVGVVEDAKLAKGRTSGDLLFSRSTRGREVEQDAADGIRSHISIGYFVKDLEVVEKRDNVPVYRITRWMPVEVSVVSVPADPSVGIEGERSIAAGEPANKEVRNMPEIQVDDRLSAEQKRTSALAELAAGTPAVADKLPDWIRNGVTVEDAQTLIIKELRSKGVGQPPAESLTEMPLKDRSRYSLFRAIKQRAAEIDGEGKFDGLEAEVHRELEKDYPLKRHGGILVPQRLGRMQLTDEQKRTLNSLGQTAGTTTVFEQQGDFIEVLRPRARVIQSGARVLTGLNGPVAFPKQTGLATVQWVPENPASLTDGDPTLGLALLTPRWLMGNVGMTRQLLSQSSIDIEGWVRAELAAAHGLAIDRAAIHGSGVNGEPKGVYKADSVNTKDFGGSVANVTIANLMQMVSNIADKNADVETMRWLTTPLLAGLLRTTLEFSAASSRTIWQGNITNNGDVLGYLAATSTQVAKLMTSTDPTGGAYHGLVFGNWADMYVAMFGALEVVVDPYSKKKQAIIEVTTYQGADVLVRHGESFSVGTSVSLT